MESKYMTLEKYAATLKVGDEVTIEYHSMAGDRQTIEKILKITKKRKNFLTILKNKERVRTMTKKERERQIKKLIYSTGVELELCLLPDAIF